MPVILLARPDALAADPAAAPASNTVPAGPAIPAPTNSAVTNGQTLLLVRGTPQGQGTKPVWAMHIDRSMAAELTSEGSLAACERFIASGAKSCVTSPAPCMSLSYWPRPNAPTPFLLQISPSDCQQARPEGAEWTVIAPDGAPRKVLGTFKMEQAPPASQ